jgi:hypothetical protein
MDHDHQPSETIETWKDAPYDSHLMPKDSPPEWQPLQPQPDPAPLTFYPSSILILLGVLLPTISFIIELVSAMCAQNIFDPLPTPFHIFIVGFVPLSNWFLWDALYKGRTKYLSLLSVTSAATIGIASFYTLVFLPVTPFAIVAIIVFGLGFLPLTPILALIATVVGRRKLKQLNAQTEAVKLPHLLVGFSLGLLGLTAAELPHVVTKMGLQWASSSDIATSQRGVKWLRTIGSHDLMLGSCYQEQRGMNDLISTMIFWGDPVMLDEARVIYYRVTGKPFNAVKPPSKLNKRVRSWGDDFEFDSALGGTTVAGQVKGLSLATSRQDQSIDANAAVSYTEWTLVFKNISTQQREARAQIALPPGGVVSRLTLWVNGEEREAAFAGRAQVRAAYNQVAIQQRRDPVLVTTSGIDRILMQCFPVPVNGEMKVRLGITAPLQLDSNEQASSPLPYLLERNFGINHETKHYVWIESKQPLTANGSDLKAEQVEGGKFALRGNVNEASLSECFVRVARTNMALKAWTPDPNSKEIIVQNIEAQPIATPSRVVFVIDGSLPMKDHAAALAATLAKLPNSVESHILLASDGVVDLSKGAQRIASNDFAAMLNDADFAGGNDNLPALLRAWDSAAEKPNSAIVWLHGTQPIAMQGIAEWQQRYQRRPNGPRFYDVQLIAGPNRLLEELERLRAIEPIPNRLNGLERLFATWSGTASRYVVTRAKAPRGHVADAMESSNHLARLWANDEVKRMIATRAKPEDTIKLAASYQLVTPVTGAVVLETKEQYERAGLEPVNSNTVPTIPEPETWALIFVVGTVLLWLFYQQRRGNLRQRI